MGDEPQNASDDYQNIVTNIILPYDPRRTKLLLGSLSYVAWEVLVSKMVRKTLRADNKSWTHLGAVHALSLPFMGGAAGFFDPNQGYEGKDDKGVDITFGTKLMDGAKGIPAVLLAEYILESFTRGFHAPALNLKDMLITGGAKALSRPLMGFIISYLPKDLKDNLRVVDFMIARQQLFSTLRSADKTAN